MKHAMTFIAALCLLTGCDYLTRHVPAWNVTHQASLTRKFPDLEEVFPKDQGDLLGVCNDTAIQYRECQQTHNALVDAIQN